MTSSRASTFLLLSLVAVTNCTVESGDPDLDERQEHSEDAGGDPEALPEAGTEDAGSEEQDAAPTEADAGLAGDPSEDEHTEDTDAGGHDGHTDEDAGGDEPGLSDGGTSDGGFSPGEDAGLAEAGTSRACNGRAALGHWPLDELTDELETPGVGTSAASGTVTRATLTTGIKGHAFYFDGASEVAIASDDFRPSDALTLSAWVLPDALSTSSWNSVVGIGSQTSINDSYWLGYFQRGVIAHFAGPDGQAPDVFDETDYSDHLGGWHHLAVSFDAGIARIYVDGELTHEEHAGIDSLAYDGTLLKIGADTNNGGPALFFAGKIDDVKVFDCVASADEIAAEASLEGSASGNGSCESLPGESLVENGGFETPIVPVGSYELFTPGNEFDGWTVVGSSGNVGPLSGQYVGTGTVFHAFDGEQTLDLTGLTMTATGVAQTLPTTPGASYCLSYWSGNAVNWGVSSSVTVAVGGTEVLTSSNDFAILNALAWRQYSVEFVAEAAETTISLTNADPTGDNSNIIDNVVVKLLE